MDDGTFEAVDNWWLRWGKRTFDVAVAVPLIVLLSPVLALAAAGVKLTSRGPLLFVQPRVTTAGTLFPLYKFRSMTADRKNDAVEIVPLSHPDITPVGKFLRRSKIDELPQLFNVLSGHMSLVGPRPDLPEHVDAYSDFKRRRLLVRSGVTGLAQVNGESSISWDERVKYDAYYVSHATFRLDVMILVKTVLVVVFGEERYARPFADSPYAAAVPWGDAKSADAAAS